MPTDPIEEVKKQITPLPDLCDRLRKEIAGSNQSAAKATAQEIEKGLETVRQSLYREFGWLLQAQGEEKKKRGLFR